jgi:alkylation response protein AidB-like acyl-CoA dehydrogenase
MDVRLSAEQQALRDSAAQVAERLGPRSVRELDDPERTAKLDAAVAASGWRDLRTATESGEPWASAVEAAVVGEELARGLADTAFLGPTLAAELRRLSGAPQGRSTETVALAGGLESLASTTVGAVGIDAAGATAALIVDDGHLSSVALGNALRSVDLTRSSVELDPSAPVMVDGGKFTGEDLARWTALGLALTCADLVGTMRGAVQLASEYAASRRQYGASIGSFQAVQHMLADAFVSMEGSRSATLYAAWAVDALEAPEALAAAAVAKAYSTRAAREVCEAAIQVHGGIGNTWDCLAHVFLRRALFSTDVLGGTGKSLVRVLDHYGLGGRDGLR